MLLQDIKMFFALKTLIVQDSSVHVIVKEYNSRNNSSKCNYLLFSRLFLTYFLPTFGALKSSWEVRNYELRSSKPRWLEQDGDVYFCLKFKISKLYIYNMMNKECALGEFWLMFLFNIFIYSALYLGRILQEITISVFKRLKMTCLLINYM